MNACMWVLAILAAVVILFKIGCWWSARSIADKFATAGNWAENFETTAKEIASVGFVLAREQRWRLQVALPIYRSIWDKVGSFQEPDMTAIKFLYFAVIGHNWGADDMDGFSEAQVVAAAREIRSATDEEVRAALAAPW